MTVAAKVAKILVVEDNPVTLTVVRAALTREGFAVVEASDGRRAIELMVDHAPDVVLLDLLLPDIEGPDLLRRFRSLPEGKKTPIIAFSAFLGKLDEARASQAGFAEFLAKPVEPALLVKTIRNCLAPQTS
jgi:two-component system cell cycle response regulator